MTSNVTYVSSIDNREKRSKLNNVIESLNKFVTCTTPDVTCQNYGTLSYCGPICVGQFIQGDKKAMKAGTPVTAMGVYLGKVNNDGLLKIENIENVTFSECTCPATITVTRNFTFDPSAAGGQSSYFSDSGWVCCMTHTTDSCTDSCGVCHVVDVWTCTYTREITDFCAYDNAYPGNSKLESGCNLAEPGYVCNYDYSGRIAWSAKCDSGSTHCTCYCGFPEFYKSTNHWGVCLRKSSASCFRPYSVYNYQIYDVCISCEPATTDIYNHCASAIMDARTIIDTCGPNQGTCWFFDGNELRFRADFYTTFCYRYYRECYCIDSNHNKYNCSTYICSELLHLCNRGTFTSSSFLDKTNCMTPDGHINFCQNISNFLANKACCTIAFGNWNAGCRFNDRFIPTGITFNDYISSCRPYVWGRFCGGGAEASLCDNSVICASSTGNISFKATTCCVCTIVRCRETCRFDFSCDICLCERYY